MRANTGSAGRRLVAGLLLVTAGLGASSCGSAAPSASTDEPARARAATVDPGTPRRLRTAFATFRSPAEGLPRRVVRMLGEPHVTSDPRLAQRLRAPAAFATWAVQGDEMLCLVSQRDGFGPVSTTCGAVDRVVEEGIFFASLEEASRGPVGAGRVVIGLVPDRTRAVRVVTPGFGTATVPVVSNTFTLRDAVPDPPERIVPVRWAP
jgi:hypothetical protein